MLIDELVAFCDEQYRGYNGRCGNGLCSHPSGNCSGNCYNCLYQIHYPLRHPEGKHEYDCPKMLYHYVCQYSYLYSTEILCALRVNTSFLSDYPYYHILSLGCGACPDLMAFEVFYEEENLSQQVSYIGFDINEIWNPIHNRILQYSKGHGFIFKPAYEDAIEWLDQNKLPKANIVVLGYLISYLFDKTPPNKMNEFIENVAKKIVSCKEDGEKLLLIINDNNSYRRGRNFFDLFTRAIRNQPTVSTVVPEYRYFDTGDLFDGQKIGSPYDVQQSLFPIPVDIKNRYHTAQKCQQTIQLLLEVQ